MKRGWTFIILKDTGCTARRIFVPRWAFFAMLPLAAVLSAGLILWGSGCWTFSKSALSRVLSSSHASGKDEARESVLGAATTKTPHICGLLDRESDQDERLQSSAAFSPGQPATMERSIPGAGTNAHTLQNQQDSSDSRAEQAKGDMEDVPNSGWLQLQNAHTSESLKIQPFDKKGSAKSEALVAVNHMMRCSRTGRLMPIDQKLIRLLMKINAAYKGKAIQMISGYRNPLGSHTRPTSYHAKGMAIDIRIPGVSIDDLWQKAKVLGARGVGLYSQSHFVHIDVRRRAFYWKSQESEEEEQEEKNLAL